MEVTIKPAYSTKIKTSCDKNHGAFLCVSDFYCYFCTKTRDIDSNSQQSAEINTVANSLPLFYPFSQTSYKQGGYKSFPELRKNVNRWHPLRQKFTSQTCLRTCFRRYSNVMTASVRASAAGMASQRPETPITRGSIRKQGTSRMIPLKSV